MKPWKDVITEPDSAKTQLIRVRGGSHEFLRRVEIFSQIKLYLDFRQTNPITSKRTYALCLSARDSFLLNGFLNVIPCRKISVPEVLYIPYDLPDRREDEAGATGFPD